MLGRLSKASARTASRYFSSTFRSNGEFNEPLSGHDMPRAGGIASMMRLPVQDNASGLYACFVGVPLDIGTSNRAGTRHGPRQIRAESSLLRKLNIATGASPFDSFQVADVGDVNLNLYNLPKACEDIRNHFSGIVQTGCIPLALGGDHTMTYPILQAIRDKHGPVGLVHVDAHADTNDTMLGEKIAHGTPFRRAMEEGCLDGHRVIQIGLRGSNYNITDYDWGREQGFRVVLGHECWHKSLTPLMSEVREMMGDRPVYITFDIDALDPAYAPGTGTPEIAGLTPAQGLEIIRGCRGMNIVGGDLVEVSPPYDPFGTTALTGANLLFEMLCVLPECKYLR
ncbi:agmatinase, mitochondrial-like isoform X2 [Ylistrum balloti]|uniref:agmatinase, mitochondrial-like isoform X2 n=1 Tax=Ylistrum balloti TaxID=509963 RepID=UPI00290595B5|nr:agmatinase, mitochondrial-like isoform X2 [Ylistrum balloti]